MPKPRPKQIEGSKILSAEDFMGGAIASKAEKDSSEATPPKEEVASAPKDLTSKQKPSPRVEPKKKERIVFVGVRIPESTAEMLEEYDQNYALRGESKNSIMAEGIRKEISARLRKAKPSREEEGGL